MLILHTEPIDFMIAHQHHLVIHSHFVFVSYRLCYSLIYICTRAGKYTSVQRHRTEVFNVFFLFFFYLDTRSLLEHTE